MLKGLEQPQDQSAAAAPQPSSDAAAAAASAAFTAFNQTQQATETSQEVPPK